MRCLLVTEGGIEAGAGHLVRNLALYEALVEAGAQVEFLVNPSALARKILAQVPYEAMEWHVEWEQLRRRLKAADVVCVDSYLATPPLLDALAAESRCLFIDDGCRHPYAKGIVANGAPYAHELAYQPAPEVTHCLGPQFALLRRPFWNMAPKLIRADVEQLLVTLGGTDPRQLTASVVQTLVQAYPWMEKWVVVGAGCRSLKEIRRVADRTTHIIETPDAPQMACLMQEVDLAISAGGQTLHELARVGTPTIALGVAENQRRSIAAYEGRKLMASAGWWDEGNWPSQLTRAVDRMGDPIGRARQSQGLRRLFDGQGARRIAQQLLSGNP